jgi:hypothetical protein
MKFKKLIFAVFLTLSCQYLYANAAGSLYNGEQFGVADYLFVQDANNKKHFYWVPNKFKLVEQSDFIIDQFGNTVMVNNQAITHSIISDDDGKKYSKYILRVKLKSPSRSQQVKALRKIRAFMGYDFGIKLKGMLPLCGITTGMPKVVGTSTLDADTIQVEMGFSETEEGTCSALNIPKTFTMSILVPMRYEPGFAQSLVDGVGAILPNVVVSHPYKYTDKVRLKIDASKFHKAVTHGGKLSGTYKVVKGTVEAKIKKAFDKLMFSSHMTFDVQNPDPKIRAHYEKVFIDMMSKTFFNFIESKPSDDADTDDEVQDENDQDNGDDDSTTIPRRRNNGGSSTSSRRVRAKKPISVRTRGGKGASPALYEASYSYGKEESREIGHFEMSLDNVYYGAITSHNIIDIPPVQKKHIHEDIRKELE